ncbi:MAG: DeoR/GlpR family DNA-binding transcription regulator, partial [Pseudomonadales bacterium]
MLEKQRQQLILDILDEQKFASVPELTEQLKSSQATIRRDITKLAEQKLIKKIRGGAQGISGSADQPRRPHLQGSAFLINKEKQAGVKRLIAQKAVELCQDGESIIINGGSSTYMMSEFLANRKLKILTTSFYLAQE